MPSDLLPSLDLVLEEVRSERRMQLTHLEALDTKAGIILGFAGALVALLTDRTEMPLLIGRFLAVAGGLAALASFWPRRFATTDLRALRDKYLASDSQFTKRNLVDASVAGSIQTRKLLIRKSLLVKVAMSCLAAAVVSVSVGFT